MVAATLARSADSGAAVGFLLLALSPALHLSNGATTGGLLATAITAPHLLGPFVAGHLDRARDARFVLVGAFVIYGIALALAGFLLGNIALPVVAALMIVAGLMGPLLIGGLSSQLAGLVASDNMAQRRAEGWDSVSYGVAGTLGPAAVSAMAALTSPLLAVLTLGTMTLIAAGCILVLPRSEVRRAAPEDVPTVRAALGYLIKIGKLRRVIVMTLLTQLSTGGLAVIAVVFGTQLTAEPSSGAFLATAFGCGNLVGSLIVTAFPRKGDPEAQTVKYTLILGAGLAFCALAPVYPLALLAFFVAGVCVAPLVTATFAARNIYSPPAARAQVFVTFAALKVAMGSAASALAASTIQLGPRILLGGGVGFTVLSIIIALLDKRLTDDRAHQSS